MAGDPSTAALAASLSGTWLIDESVSKNTGDLLKYFGMPWLLQQGVLASATPPMEFLMTPEGDVTIVYPGLFPLKNHYVLGGAKNTHNSMWSKQDCTVALSKDREGNPAFVITVPQGDKGDLIISHSLRGTRHHVLILVVLKGEEKVHIPRFYDLKK